MRMPGVTFTIGVRVGEAECLAFILCCAFILSGPHGDPGAYAWCG